MNKYHRKFIDSFAAENIIGIFSRYRGSSKEITESWGMLQAAKRFVEDIDEYMVVVVGDGCSPRTGVMFAYFTKAEVVSVDPNFNLAHWNEHSEKQAAMGYPPQRISLIAKKIEDIEVDCKGKKCLVVWPHSHAPMNQTNITNYETRTDIAMPCCRPIPRNLAEKPHISYDDYNIASPKRTVHVWLPEMMAAA